MARADKEFNKKEYDKQYHAEHYYRFSCAIPKKFKEKIEEKAKAEDKSKNAWLRDIIAREISEK